MKAKPPKPKKCRCGCGNTFTPRSPLQIAATPECALRLVIKKREKETKEKEKAERMEDKKQRENIKTRSVLTKEAQEAVNRYRRIEELMKGCGCISCGRSQAEVQETDGWKPGGAWDAGHFMSVGAMPAKRFDPMNIWLQCKSCNAGSGKYARKAATVAKAFEANLIERIGIDEVERLKRDDGPAKLSLDDLRYIRDYYRAKLRELQKIAA